MNTHPPPHKGNTPHPAEMRVLDSLLALNLGVSLWSARKKLTLEDFGNVELPPDDLATLGSKRIAPPESLRIFGTLKARAFNYLDRHGVRFMSGWAIPEEKAADIMRELMGIRDEFMVAKEQFLVEYHKTIEDWIAKHKEWGSIIASSVVSPDYVRAREEIKRSSTALRTRLHRLLQANTQTPCILGRRGKLCSSKLHHLASHNPRVFLKHGHKKAISTAVHLLLDCSGSMDGSKMKLACKATYGVALALEHCQGVNVGVTAFPATATSNQKNTAAVFPMLKHGQKVHPRFQVKASGCTPLTESLWWVMQQMYTLKEERKIILILSDGVPDSLYTTKHALAHAHKLGFEVLALGMEDNSLEMLLPKTSRTIHDLNMLPSTMFSILQQSLLKQ